VQWTALTAAIFATTATIAIWEHGQWRLGLFVPLPRAVIEALIGLGFAICLIGAADALIILTTDLRHERGTGFPFRELLLVFIPAALHEELAFRGYAFQKLWRWRRWTAIAVMSLVFAALHLGNDAVTMIGITNVFLGGVVLSLAYARYERLWFPIGLHLGWNVLTGPVLGYEVSGYAPEVTILRTVGSGPPWLTGGRFGIEGSLWMTLLEVVAIATLLRRRHD
jgi:membrane protease YdiL (CAAX protease family)